MSGILRPAQRRDIRKYLLLGRADSFQKTLSRIDSNTDQYHQYRDSRESTSSRSLGQ